MEKQSSFVKGENQSRREFLKTLGKQTTAGLALLSFGISALADKPYNDVISPLDKKYGTSPQTSNRPTEKKVIINESYLSSEEKNPYSRINKLYNFYPRYWFLNDEEKQLIDERIIKTSSGGEILVSERACPKHDPIQIQQLQQEGEKKYLEHFSSLGKEHFMVIDKGKTYVWSIEPPSEASCVMLQKDKPPIAVKYKGKDTYKTNYKNARSSFDEEYGLVINDGIRISEVYDFSDAKNYEFVFDENGAIQIEGINPEPLEYPVAMGKPLQELKKNLYDFFVADPSFFADPEKVIAFIKNEHAEDPHTAEIEIIRKINGDPTVFFLPTAGVGPRKFNNPKFIEAIQLAMHKMEEVDPQIFDLLYKFGLRSIVGDPLDNFVTPVLVPNSATYDYKNGIVYINEKRLMNLIPIVRPAGVRAEDLRRAEELRNAYHNYLLSCITNVIYNESNAIYSHTQNRFDGAVWMIGINKTKSFEFWVRQHADRFKDTFMMADEDFNKWLEAENQSIGFHYLMKVPPQSL